VGIKVIDRLAAKSNIRSAGRDGQSGTPAPNLIQAGRPKGFPGNSRQPAQRAPALVPANPAWADYPNCVVKAYDALHPRSALKRLSSKDKFWIWVHLEGFAEDKNRSRKTRKTRFPQQLEHAARAGLDALRLAMEIEKILKKDYGEPFNRSLRNSRHLPAFLLSFAKTFSPIYMLGATESRREHALIDLQLIYVCHFVRIKTGAWHDEQVATLLQTMRSEQDDFSADAIRKKRKRFQSEHPEFFLGIAAILKRKHEPPSFWDQVAAGVALGEKPISQS
jgi:hypothetical protein